jgi:hypothetical protein
MTTTKLNLMTDDQLIAFAQKACQPLTILYNTSDETAIEELLVSLLIEMEQTERLLSPVEFSYYMDALDPDDDDEDSNEDSDDDEDDYDDDDFEDDDDDDLDGEGDDDDEPAEDADEEDDM